MTTYYYPSTYASAAQNARANANGVRRFVGQGQAPAGSYTVITPIEGTNPQEYTVTADYTGPGTGYTSIATATRYSDQNHIEAFIRAPGQGAAYLILSNSRIPARFRHTFPRNSVPFQFNGAMTTDPTTVHAMCFLSGTMIRTVAGEKAVEDLAVGDLVETASGTRRPIKWLGHRAVACRRQLFPRDVAPVRIAAHAFGQNLPTRDLFLSPGHPVLVGADEDGDGGHLVPIMCLINGTTIDRFVVDEVIYWHVELDAHDILLAEGLAAESYIDGGDRAFFIEGSDDALADPDFVVPGLAGRCRPVAVDGPVVEAERRRLDAVFATRLAMASAWPSADDAPFAF